MPRRGDRAHDRLDRRCQSYTSHRGVDVDSAQSAANILPIPSARRWWREAIATVLRHRPGGGVARAEVRQQLIPAPVPRKHRRSRRRLRLRRRRCARSSPLQLLSHGPIAIRPRRAHTSSNFKRRRRSGQKLGRSCGPLRSAHGALAPHMPDLLLLLLLLVLLVRRGGARRHGRAGHFGAAPVHPASDAHQTGEIGRQARSSAPFPRFLQRIVLVLALSNGRMQRRRLHIRALVMRVLPPRIPPRTVQIELLQIREQLGAIDGLVVLIRPEWGKRGRRVTGSRTAGMRVR